MFSPSLGMLWRDEFIPLAEDTELIELLGQWTIKQACRHARDWHDQMDRLTIYLLLITIRLSEQLFLTY